MITVEKLCWYWISKKEEIGVKTTNLLLEEFGCIEEVYYADIKHIKRLPFLSKKAILQFEQKILLDEIKFEYEQMIERGIKFIIKKDDNYPEKLREIYNSPWFLYYRGELPDVMKPSLAIIGARNCSVYGSEVAKSFAKSLSSMGVQIISGLARGIDSFAHIGALNGSEGTFGVIGNGVDLCYPKENLTLYQKLEKRGGIISEYPLGSKALPFHFPMRNRIISGLSDGILVIEAREKSGTLITVDHALEQGREVFSMPGRVTDQLSIGCNRLIQNGAKLVLDTNDILEELRICCQKRGLLHINNNERELPIANDRGDRGRIIYQLTDDEYKVYQNLSQEPKHLDVLVSELQQPIASIIEKLCILELKGAVMQVSTHYYVAFLN